MKDACKNNLTKISVIYYHWYDTGMSYLLAMTEKLRKIGDKKDIFAAVLTDLSKPSTASVIIYL